MAITVEAATWNEEQLKEELAIRMPPKWYFVLTPDEEASRWRVTIFDGSKTQAWEGEGIHSQLVLLDAIGWLEARLTPIPDGSPWKRRRGEITQSQIYDQIFSKLSTREVPPDLTPTEIESLYSRK